MGHTPTVVIGGGQTGLSVSHELLAAGVDHVVLERAAVAQAWRDRWDSFTLVTPNWTLDLPGSPYAGDDPEGHVSRDEIVAYVEAYAAHHAGEIREGVRVDALGPGGPARFRLDTSDGPIDAEDVVVCTGAYQRPHRPPVVADVPAGLLVIDATQYTSPAALPVGQVLVVGSGQTGSRSPRSCTSTAAA
jgi:putative flavoprotein involved in K+ transport